MNTISLHILTAFIPVFLIVPGIILVSGAFGKNQKRRKAGYYLIIINAVATILTSALGGSVISVIKSLPNVSIKMMSAHAWTGMAAMVFSIIIAVLAYLRTKRAVFMEKKDPVVLSLAVFYIIFFLLTVILAYNIKSS